MFRFKIAFKGDYFTTNNVSHLMGHTSFARATWSPCNNNISKRENIYIITQNLQSRRSKQG
uniref:Uncharacterized protein n=1 Tax=Rhizophora mucronata TaxID=61149 RepID=A0A2P2J5P3_RHIMU